MGNILEASMLICFGLSWPLNVIKNIQAKSARNMSLKFTLLIIIGYIAGISAKIITHNYSYVLIVYVLNLLIVCVNVPVYFINKKADRDAMSGEHITPSVSSIDTYMSDFEELNMFSVPGGIVFFGGTYFARMDIADLARINTITETVYSRCALGLKAKDALRLLESGVYDLEPSKVFINIGDAEAWPHTSLKEFITVYTQIISGIKENSSDTRIFIVSVNPASEHSADINRKLYRLARKEGVDFVDVTREALMPLGYENVFHRLASVIKEEPAQERDRA